MAGADTVLRLVFGTMSIITVAFVAAVGYTVMDPIFAQRNTELMTGLGWGTPHETVMLFAGLAFIGISMVVILWWLVAPVRQDVRQQAGPPL